MEASVIACKFLILQHATLKCILEAKYDQLINVILYDKFISLNLLRRHSQYMHVVLTCSGAVFANQEILLAFIFRKTNRIKPIKLQLKNKEETQKQRLLKMQQSTTQAIKEQVSLEVDQQLPGQVTDLVVESI